MCVVFVQAEWKAFETTKDESDENLCFKKNEFSREDKLFIFIVTRR
jgi:hypothetical protein